MKQLRFVMLSTLKICFSLLFITSLIASGVIFNLLSEASQDLPTPHQDDLAVFQSSSQVYDFQGTEVNKLRGKTYRLPVKIEEVPQVMQDAIVAVEDERFYDHRGIDYWGLGRAVIKDIRSGSEEGASTITQQVVKNSLLTPEKSISRKIREAFLARQVETTCSKREILELYLNMIYLGEGAYGVEAAARTYLGKPVSKLNLAESALIAGLSKNPSRYSPFANPEDARNRRNTVLNVMYRNGYISSPQLAAASAAPLPAKRYFPEDNYPYPYFLDQVISELIQKHGFSENQVYDGGLQIYTTLNPKIQQALEATFADPENFPAAQDTVLPQGAMVILEQATGSIRGLVGGRSHTVRRGFNRATMLRRQPGSAFKPLVVYAPAIEKGYGPATILDSSLEVYGQNEDSYSPDNMGNVSWGKISMRTAISNSVNTYAVKMLRIIGINDGYDFGKRLGLNSLIAQDKVLGLALGGVNLGLSPLELATAYAPLANKGIKVEPYLIQKVTDARGKVLFENKPQVQRVMKQETADMITDLLQSAVQEGTGKQARLPDRPVAGKTGTTQLPDLSLFKHLKQGNKDAWFAGYTPELVGVVWLGYDITDATHYLSKVYGGSYPAIIWQKVMSNILMGTPPSKFAPPPAEMIAAEKRILVKRSKPSAPIPESKPPQPLVVDTKVKAEVAEKVEGNATKQSSPILNKLLSLFGRN